MIPGFLLLFAAGLTINHQPVECFVKDRYAQLDVDVQPPLAVTEVRVYFRAARTEEFHWVPMVLTEGRFVGKLPKPKDKAQSVTYYIGIIGAEGTVRKTPEITGEVVKSAEGCPAGARLADVGDEGDVRVWAMTDSRSKPKDFGGVDKVIRPRDTVTEQAASVPPTGETAAAGEASREGDRAMASPTPLPSRTPTPAAVTEEPEEYPIGADDIVRVAVFGHDDLTQTVLVQSDGTFIYPLIGRVKAADLTPKELERKLTVLLGQGYVRNPQVTVSVQEYRSKTVFVVGEVSRPGSYALGGRMTVLELLSKAGPTSGAGAEVVIVRPRVAVGGPLIPADLTDQPGDENSEAAKQADLIRVNIRDIQMGQLDKNILVRPNDTVFVTQAARIYVTGEVRTPGAVTYWPGATVWKVINTAGGFTDDASKGKIRVIREVEGKLKEIKIGLDDPVQPGDTIVVKAKLF